MRVSFCARCDTKKVTMQSSELHGRGTNTKGFGKKINDISEDTLVDLDGAQEKGCVNPWAVCRQIGLQ